MLTLNNIRNFFLINLLKFYIIDSNHFCFEYEQNKRFIKMKKGSSLTPIMVEILLDNVITETLLRMDFVSPFWHSFTYVDDQFLRIKSKMYSMLCMLLTQILNLLMNGKFNAVLITWIQAYLKMKK